jgi:N-acetylglucosamine transport system substrate-binding protein
MYKKVTCVLLAVLIVMVSFAGCVSDKKAPPTKQTKTTEKTAAQTEKKKEGELNILCFVGGMGQMFDPIAEEFKKINPEVKVNIEYNQQAHEIIRTRLLAGNAPDINVINANLFDHYGAIAEGLIKPLNFMLEAKTLDGSRLIKDLINPDFLQFGLVDGKNYLITETMYLRGMWYDKKLFRDNGWDTPTTWDEFVQVGEKAKKVGIAPLVYQGKYADEYFLMYWFIQNVLSIDENAYKKIQNLEPGAWSTDAIKETLERLKFMIDNDFIMDGSVAFDETQAQMPFINHEAATVTCGTWLETEMEGSWPDEFELTFLPTPGRKDTSGTNYVAVGETVAFVPSTTKNEDLITKFYQVAYTNEMIKTLAKQNSVIRPIYNASEILGEFLSKSVVSCFDAVDEGRAKPFVYMWYRWYREIPTEAGNALNAMVLGNIDAKQFMTRMEDIQQKVIDDPNIVKYTVE